MSDEAAPESQDLWRLGHRRPWWQWNVVTLFVVLFILVWARELLRLTQQATWLIGASLLLAWFAVPALWLPTASDDRGNSDAGARSNLRIGLLAVVTSLMVGLFAMSGFVAGVVGCAAALLVAVAIRSWHD